MNVADTEETPQGTVYRWHSPNGRVTDQLRIPDADRTPGGPKYVWSSGVEMPVGVPLGMEDAVADPSIPLVIVEGTRQHLTAAEAALASSTPRAVVGISGAWCWMQDDAPLQDWQDIPLEGRQVCVCFDADVATNRNVWDAAKRLSEFLTVEGGAASVQFVLLSGSKDGLDDILNRSRNPVSTFDRLVNSAQPKLPRQPAKGSRSPLFDADGSMLAMKTYEALRAKHPMAVTQEKSVAVYDRGLYWNGNSKMFTESLVNLLGDYYRKSHQDTMLELCLGLLSNNGEVIPERPDRLLINVRNGLLDPVTLTLHPHDPTFRTLFQFDVEWDPDATCPTYEAWAEAVLPGRIHELEDAICPMLNPLVTPAKAVFLYGPSRSGKSTFGRLLEFVVGQNATSAVTLHQMSDDSFASANLYGKVLNLAMDLPSRDVRDLSTFKLVTGDDKINGNRKYGQQFTFTNQALLLFSANEIPTVSETSKAWLARVAPFKFGQSFIGAEDPSIEKAMLEEAPGIFRRWVLALQAHLARGGYLDYSQHEDTEEFNRKTNRVREFLAEQTEPCERPQGTARTSLYARYKVWAEENGGKPMGRNRFFDSVRNVDVGEFKPEGGSWSFEVLLTDPETKGSSAVLAPLGSFDPVTTVGWDTSETDSETPKGEEVENCRETAEQQVSGTFQPSETADETAEQNSRALVFDLETADADDLHRLDPGFIRITGTETAVGSAVLDSVLTHPGALVAHNGFGFDFLALRAHGFDMLTAADQGRLIDTMVLAPLSDPPPFGMKGEQVRRYYSLNNLATRLGVPAKVDDIKRLAKEHGGFDQIPLDDPEYLAYCAGDVATTRGVFDALPPMDDYAVREMRFIGRLSASITGTGFRVDEALNDQRYNEGQERIAKGLSWLVDSYGLPTTRKDGKESTHPLATAAGKEAVAAAFHDLGIDLPRTEKSGAPSLKKEHMQKILDWPAATPDQRALAEVVGSIVGVRTVYQTIRTHAINGRVHPSVFPGQASGRLSLFDPGLTVFGKRKGRHIERAVLLPDEGEVLLAFDLDQIDARAVAAHAQDPAYLELFGPGRDSHQEIANMLGLSRDAAKMVGHAWNYGGGVRKIADSTGLDLDVVKVFDQGMRERFPRLVSWRDEVRAEAAGGGRLGTGLGRWMKPDPERSSTQGPALVGQGTARDLMAEGVLRLPLDVAAMIRAFVHDEIILSVPVADIDDVTATVLDALTFQWAPPGASMPVKVTAGVSRPGSSWAGCYEKGEK